MHLKSINVTRLYMFSVLIIVLRAGQVMKLSIIDSHINQFACVASKVVHIDLTCPFLLGVHSVIFDHWFLRFHSNLDFKRFLTLCFLSSPCDSMELLSYLAEILAPNSS